MRPWQHARASAGRDRDWRDDLPIHEFMDVTKCALADLRHRMVLHNADLGPELAARMFPERAEARTVALQHVHEDLGWTPALADWLACCPADRLMAPPLRYGRFDAAILAVDLARRQGLASHAGPAAVIELLTLPLTLAPAVGDGAMSVLFNSAGPLIVRRVLGPPREEPGRNGRTAVFDAAWTAEAAIYASYGRLPSLEEALSPLRQLPVAVAAG